MHLYKAKILLAGNMLHNVWKDNITAAEIKILEHIHAGPNYPVTAIELIGTTTRSDRAERARLLRVYGEYKLGQGAKLINDLLGVDGVPLPQEYAAPVTVAVEEVMAEDQEVITLIEPEVVTPVAPIVRTKAKKVFKDEAAALAG